MRILTKIGFYSIIKKRSHLNPDGPAVFNIRGRDKDDLKRFAELVSADLAKRPVVHEYEHSDYPYRVYLNTQEEMDAAMAKLSALIDYGNFKDTIKATPHQKPRLEPCEEFWSLLYNAHFFHRPRRQ
ncbi:MAG: hypothetical protein ACKOHM_01280 [Spartobacteria bacterium]